MTSTTSADSSVVLNKILKDVNRAIEVRSLYVQCADQGDIIESYRNTQAWHGFATVRNALLLELIIILMRIYDKRKDSASLPSLCKKLLGDQGKSRSKFLDRIKSLECEDQQKALRNLRNKVLAHTAIDSHHSPTAKFGSAEALLDKTIIVVHELALELIGTNCAFDIWNDAWTKNAEAFWNSASSGRR